MSRGFKDAEVPGAMALGGQQSEQSKNWKERPGKRQLFLNTWVSNFASKPVGNSQGS